MLNRWVTFLGTIGTIFVLSTTPIALGQSEPSQLEILNAIHSVDKNVAVLSTKLEGVEKRLDEKIENMEKQVDKRFEGVDKQIAQLQGTLTWIYRGIFTIVVSILGFAIRMLWKWIKSPSRSISKGQTETNQLQQGLTSGGEYTEAESYQ